MDGRRFGRDPRGGGRACLGPGGVGPGLRGGLPRVLRPAGVPGVAGPPSCWWRWDPVRVYPVARLAPSLARPSRDRPFPTRSPGPRPLCASSPSPPTRPPPSPPPARVPRPHGRGRAARAAPLTPPSVDRNRPRRCWVSCPPPWPPWLGGGPSPGEVLSVLRGRGGGRRAGGVGAGRRCACAGERSRENRSRERWRLGPPSPARLLGARRGGPGRRPRVPRDRPCAGGLGRWDPACAPGRPTSASRVPSEASRKPLAVARGPLLHRSRSPFSGAWLAPGRRSVSRPRPFPKVRPRPSSVLPTRCRAPRGARRFPGPLRPSRPRPPLAPAPRRWRCVVTRGRRRLPPPPTPAGRVPALARACPGRGSGPRRPLAVGRPRPRARLPGGGEGFGLRPGAPPPSRVSACSARCRPRRDRRASPSPARGPPPPPSGPSGGGEGGG